MNIPGVECDANYQLNIEDALDCAGREIVVFVDAACDTDGPFVFQRLEADYRIPALTHALPPGGVLAVMRSVFDRSPDVYVLGVKGYEWDEGEGLSAAAEANLGQACSFLADFLRKTAK